MGERGVSLVTTLKPFSPLPGSRLISIQKTPLPSADSRGVRSSVPGARGKDHIFFIIPQWGVILMRSDEEHMGRPVTGM